MKRKKSLGFWLGMSLLVIVILQYIQIPFISRLFSPLLPIAGAVVGIYMIIKE